MAALQGRWYITAGLNPLFDQFDCQEHYFGVPEPGMLTFASLVSSHLTQLELCLRWAIQMGQQH